jgi:DNA-binding beta-propeller fold protein YncE
MQQVLVRLGLLALLTSTASAAVLYGVGSYEPFASQSLYRIDAATGVATAVGNTGLSEINGIAWSEATQTLFAYTTDADLYRLNPATGAASLIAARSEIVPEGDIALGTGGAYVSFGADLARLNLATGALEIVGPFGDAANDVSGLAFDAAGALYGYSKNGLLGDTLLSIDPATGAASERGLLGIESTKAVGGLAFDPDNGGLYLTDHEALFLVDPATGNATPIGAHGVSGMSGIAFVPEPCAALFLLLPLLFWNRRSN